MIGNPPARARPSRSRHGACLRLLLLPALVFGVLSVPTFGAAPVPYAGSDSCKGCHEDAWKAWRGSHHYRAMRPADEDSVLGDFSGKTFEYGGVTSRFFRRDGKYFVETDNERGELQAFEVAYTFGFYPLQQYLIAFPRGRYQALNVVWDSRPAEQGGQRWMHLYPADMASGERPVDFNDLVHWTGSFQNWNSRCAACHSTGLEKNYSASSNRYDTRWQEIDVACEACHGPAGKHLEWARSKNGVEGNGDPGYKGFAFSLADRGTFGPAGEDNVRIFSRLDGKHPVTQVQTCAACHARRSDMGPTRPGVPFEDQFRLALIEPGLYFPDGQIRQEVYVYGSFLQSRMNVAGVVCTNCHEPHSNALRIQGNALCGQCHVPAIYDRPEHHHHEAGKPGAACVDCHMPARTYMVVDDRRDHSFRIPEPRLSVELGVPNACDRCHGDKGAQWAADAVAGWGAKGSSRAEQASAMAAAWSGNASSLPDLLPIAANPNQPAIVRASAALAASNFPSRETLATTAQLLSEDNDLLRASAVRSLEWLRPGQRMALLKHLATDESKAVRNEVARQLEGISRDRLSAEDRKALEALDQEYLETLRFNADMPETQMNLALWYASNGDAVSAEQAYRKALELAPAFVPALLNLADLYRANGLDAKAEPLLREAIEREPDQAPPQHAMGLLLIRQGKLDQALPFLAKAAAAEPDNVRYGYVYAVGLWEQGQRQQAVDSLEKLLTSHPGNPDLVSALASYYQQLGEQDKLQKFIEQTQQQ